MSAQSSGIWERPKTYHKSHAGTPWKNLSLSGGACDYKRKVSVVYAQTVRQDFGNTRRTYQPHFKPPGAVLQGEGKVEPPLRTGG